MCKIAPSTIHGVGVFTIRDVKKGERMGCRGVPNQTSLQLDSLDGLLPEVRELIEQRWTLAKTGGVFQSPNDDARLISFMNHSNSANYNHTTDEALVDIKKDTEVLENYGSFSKNMV